MTGDDINNAPILGDSDVGLSMGNKGTNTASKYSQIILSGNNIY